jgi:hypothetical protein
VDRYAPSDPIAAVAWLFDTWTLDSTGDTGEAERRVEALRDLLTKQGLDAVLRLGIETKLPHLVVEALARTGVSSTDIETLLVKAIEADPESNFGVGLAALHREIAGQERAEGWLTQEMGRNGWSAEVTAHLLLGWPDQASTWHTATRLGSTVAAAYWAMKSPHWVKGSKHDLIRAELSLLRYGHGIAALKTGLNRLKELPTKLILRILDSMVLELNERKSADVGMIRYELERTFEELDGRGDLSDLEISRREFAFLPFLEGSNRMLHIHKLMARDPVIYHEVLREVFRGDNEPQSEPDEAAKARWRMFYSLLSKFALVPGQDEEDIDVAALSQWVDQVREAGAKTGRVEITDQYIGHVLAHAGRGVDGYWPHGAVREQIERLKSEQLERGIQIERFNMRGPHWRGLYDGGGQERALAADYYRGADMVAAWPRTAALLKAIGKHWQADAVREDVRANQRKLRS